MYKLSKVKQNLCPSFSENIGYVWRIKGFNYYTLKKSRLFQSKGPSCDFICYLVPWNSWRPISNFRISFSHKILVQNYLGPEISYYTNILYWLSFSNFSSKLEAFCFGVYLSILPSLFWGVISLFSHLSFNLLGLNF